MAAMLACVASVWSQTSQSAQQAELERLKITIVVKQERIEQLEREVARLRRLVNVDRDRKIVADITREVERLRGLRAKQPIEVAPLTHQVVERIMGREINDRYSSQQFRGYELFLQHMGLIPATMNLDRFFRDLLSEQAAGLYDDDTKKLYVSDQFDLESNIAKMILAHEICHALQDQNFNLTSSPLHLKTNDDRETAADCVIEGDAMILMVQFGAGQGIWKTLLELPGLLMMDQKVVSSAPRFFYRMLLFPYLQGNVFVTRCMEEWGPSGRNRVLRRFPSSTKQILHPDKYIGPDVEEPIEVSLDDVTSAGLIPAENRFGNVVGEFGLQCILGDRLSGREADEAAAGWRGDRFAFGGRLDGDYALAWLSLWESDQDAREFAGALQRYFKLQRPELAEQTDTTSGTVWLSDKQGSIAIVRKGDGVACVHANDQPHASRLLDALLAVQIRREPQKGRRFVYQRTSRYEAR
jgi:hypothetical protein